MRPHDIVVLLKISTYKSDSWFMKDLAIDLAISQSEITESINRSVYAGFISSDKKRLFNQALLEFLEHGVKYVYPQKPGKLVRGVPTAYSAAPLNNDIHSTEPVVWPFSEGTVRGQEILPLHVNIPKVCLKDNDLYELLSLVDAIRIGRVREVRLAVLELKKKLL